MSKTDTFEAAILNYATRGTPFSVSTSTPYLALFKVAPTDSSAGTECDYTGYAQQPLGTAKFGSIATAGSITNTAAVNFPTNAGSAQTVVAVGIRSDSYDGTSSALFLSYYQVITPVSIGNGEVPKFSIGNIVINED